jgi:hypothetical protein
MWNLVSDIKGGTLTEGILEKCAENILIEEVWNGRRLQNEELHHNLYSSP